MIDVGYDKDEIYKAITSQINKKKIKKSYLYGDGFSHKRIIKILNRIFKKKVSVEKELNYLWFLRDILIEIIIQFIVKKIIKHYKKKLLLLI